MTTHPNAPEKAPGLPAVDVNEYGGKKDGVRQAMNRRLFMQLLVGDVPGGVGVEATLRALHGTLATRNIPSVLYADTVNPRGFGLLTWHEDPAHFVDRVRPVFDDGAFSQLAFRDDYAMLGRTYSTGHEPDLEYVLLRRSIDNVLRPAYGWHVWYPLRRNGEFAKLDPHEQSQILREHAALGMAYGQSELAHDIRLACHGLDGKDNEFVIGLVGGELHSLSHLVQAMRKTKQTSTYIAQMGPFFVGRVVHRVDG